MSLRRLHRAGQSGRWISGENAEEIRHTRPPRRAWAPAHAARAGRGNGRGEGAVWYARSVLTKLVREAYRREVIPEPLLWAMAADGMFTFYAMLRRGLEKPLGSRERAREEIAKAAGLAYARRWTILRERFPGLPSDEDAPARVLGALSMSARHPKGRWVFANVAGAPPRTAVEHLRVERELRVMSSKDRWVEVSTHLGEVLIQMTHTLPSALPGANAVLGQVCFDGGRMAGEQAKKALSLPDGPESAIEVLRMSEYVFRVNPEHSSEADAAAMTGMIEGSACPWFTAPGWSMKHCGIFGQFQSGIASVFGLRYQLTSTIPKHGGHTCRIDLRPLKRKDGTLVTST